VRIKQDNKKIFG